MRKTLLLLSAISLILISLQDCKPDPPISPPDNDADSLYVGTTYTIQRPFRFPPITNSYKDSLTVEGIELGRRLFYDKHLSSTGQLSCASCHKQEFAFSDAGHTLSTNVFGPTKRNSPAIQNLIWSNKLFWDGRVNTLAQQAQDAFHGELNLNLDTNTANNAIRYLASDSTYMRLFKKAFGRPGNVTEDKIYNALQQFMAILISSDSRLDSVQRGQAQFTTSEQRGFQIYMSEVADCAHCHMGNNDLMMTDNIFRNNGVDSPTVDLGRQTITGNPDDEGTFRDPSLRNIALTGPYMHDGRIATLEDAVKFYNEKQQYPVNVDVFMRKPNHANGGLHLHPDDVQALIDFLHTLTDHKFVTNPAFSDPF